MKRRRDGNKLRILAIEPFNHWHWKLDAFLIRCLKTIGSVTFVAPKEYLKSCDVDLRLNIPNRFLQNKTSIVTRLNSIRLTNYIKNNVQLEYYDAIIFLAYETLSFLLCWPKNIPVYLVEHNNIYNAHSGRLKTFFYRRIPSNAVGIVFQNHIARYLYDRCSRKTVTIPHPYYRDASTLKPFITTTGGHGTRPKRITIFSPSGSTPRAVNELLKNFAINSEGTYYVICKGDRQEKTFAYETRPFFDDYEELMSTCDMVFIGAHLDYRVSGVAYEALSYGKPLIIPNCLFAQELHQHHPHLVFQIRSLEEIANISPEPSPEATKDHQLFLSKHSFKVISKIISESLRK